MKSYSKIAAALLCFDREDYTKQTIKSLECAVESNDIDWFVFQDGAENLYSGKKYAEKEDLDAVAKIIRESSLPIQSFIRQYSNISPAQQRYKALSLLNEYDLLYVFEDDMVVGKYYLYLLRLMAEQFPKHIGIMYRRKNRGNYRNNRHKLDHLYTARLWGHYMNSDVYNLIREDYTGYYEGIKDQDYHLRRTENFNYHGPDNVPWVMDDIVINRLCKRNKVRKLQPFISRARYIGKFGYVAYKTEEYWKRKGMHNQEDTITHEKDREIKKLILK